MKNGWTKFFADGTSEIGSDEDVQRGFASWRNGRLDNLVAVALCHNDYIIELKVPHTGHFWQEDDYECNIATGATILSRRRIKVKIETLHRVAMFNKTSHKLTVLLQSWGVPAIGHGTEIIKDNIGKWLSLEIDSTGSSCFIGERKVLLA